MLISELSIKIFLLQKLFFDSYDNLARRSHEFSKASPKNENIYISLFFWFTNNVYS